ncbi:hypothetical protein K493DRAFT_301033 [Basidiobolus meristosporus CBS 931.73]|uniref:4Fe-4S ferredoxin-type domain-containing protein n=1 Tax=Basidiobolus meristosporus CBS 931.73 TaxID=1314790 RepID=A0A1Y1YDW0_9FUNG|nr:hypothetical protein K493DRAFT_301033 [Basidiobolus meristosporus CBS 931.73]|eukprot:ORX96187.1 hypothetical protein K493DRAFT_301033 [Basidiobolus meristosporus CBS 931.73]
MRLTLILPLISFILVAAQEDHHEIQNCLAQCDQDDPEWVNCASDCVGLPPTEIDDDLDHEWMECANECNDGGSCPSWCQESHSENVTGESSNSIATSNADPSEEGPFSTTQSIAPEQATHPATTPSSHLATNPPSHLATHRGTQLTTHTSMPTGQSVMSRLSHSMNSFTTSSPSVTSARVARTPIAFVPQMNDASESKASFNVGILATAALYCWNL